MVRKEEYAPIGLYASGYHYDKAGRLTFWDNGTTQTSYDWDKAGNLVAAGGETAQYNERNRLLSRGGTDYSYSARGTLTERTTGGVTTDVRFDAYGQMAADGAKSYSYDALNRLVSSGQRSVSYVGDSLNIASDGNSQYSYGADGSMFGVSDGSTAKLAVSNEHRDLVGALDSDTGELIDYRNFQPFGEVESSMGSTPSVGYQGQFTDSDSGNVSMGARWYQPGTGAFASRDRTGLDPRDLNNANRFSYTAANPMTQTAVHRDRIARYRCCCFSDRSCGYRRCGGGAVTMYGYHRYQEWRDSRRRRPPRVPRPPGPVGHGSQSDEVSDTGTGGGPIGGPVGPDGSPTGGGGFPVGGGSGGAGAVAAGGSVVSARLAAARAAARREVARLAALRRRVRRDATTPHARPELTESIAPGVRDALERARGADPVELGVLRPESRDGAGSSPEGFEPTEVPAAVEVDGSGRRSSHRSSPAPTRSFHARYPRPIFGSDPAWWRSPTDTSST